MKRVSVLGFAAVLFLASCGESGSSTVGSYEESENASSQHLEKEGHGEGHGESKDKEHEKSESEHSTMEHSEHSDTTGIMNTHKDSIH